MMRQRSWQNCPGAARLELEFNLCCGRALVDPAANATVRRCIQQGIDWTAALAVAERHRLTPVVYDVVSGAARDLLSDEQWDQLQCAAAPSVAAGKALLWELIRLHRLLEGAQIPVIPYKGPLLARVAYGSFLRREYLDLDFAVEQKNIPAILNVLEPAGYLPQFDRREAHAGRKGIAPGQYSFQSHAENILAEFHTERTLRYFPVPIDFPDLNSRLMTVEIGEARLRTFSIEDTLVMLCVHGGKHFWERLGWVLDIAKLSTAQPVDWDRLQWVAGKMESTRVVHLGLFLAYDLFGAALPGEVLEEILQDPVIPGLVEKVYEQYSDNSAASLGVFPRAVFRLRSRDKFWPGLRHLLRLGLSPTESDLQTVRLPDYLAPLYVFVRPWRLLKQYGWGGERKARKSPGRNRDREGRAGG